MLKPCYNFFQVSLHINKWGQQQPSYNKVGFYNWRQHLLTDSNHTWAVMECNYTTSQKSGHLAILKVPYYEKHIFSGVYIFKLVLPEPTNSQNEESKQVLPGLCSPPTGKTALLQAVQIQLFSLRNKRRDVHRPTSSMQWYELSEKEVFIPEVKFSVPSGKIAVFRNVVSQS